MPAAEVRPPASISSSARKENDGGLHPASSAAGPPDAAAGDVRRLPAAARGAVRRRRHDHDAADVGGDPGGDSRPLRPRPAHRGAVRVLARQRGARRPRLLAGEPAADRRGARRPHPEHDPARRSGLPRRSRARRGARPDRRVAPRHPRRQDDRRHRRHRHRHTVVLVRAAGHLRLRVPAAVVPDHRHAFRRASRGTPSTS